MSNDIRILRLFLLGKVSAPSCDNSVVINVPYFMCMYQYVYILCVINCCRESYNVSSITVPLTNTSMFVSDISEQGDRCLVVSSGVWIVYAKRRQWTKVNTLFQNSFMSRHPMLFASRQVGKCISDL